MDGRTATIAAAGVAIVGVIAFVILDGVSAGLVLFVAGVVLVAIGIFGWHEAAPAVATADAVTMSAADAERDAPMLAGRAMQPADDDGSPAVTEDASRDVLSGSPENDEGSPPEPVSDEMPAPHPFVGGAEAVADPLGRGETEPAFDREPVSEPHAESSASAESEPTMLLTGVSELDHVHEDPLRNHTDLVRHVEDYHPGVRTDGSTIQLRLLHEREHGDVVS
jgi:hypothetical protein